MDLGDVQLEVLDGLENQGGLDVRGVRRESLQGAAEAVVVELLGGQAVVVGQGGSLGPLADTEQGFGLEQAVGDQDLDEGAQGDVSFPRDEVIDGRGEVDLFEVVGDDRQRADDLRLEPSVSVHVRHSWVTGFFARFARDAAAMLPPRFKPARGGAEREYLALEEIRIGSDAADSLRKEAIDGAAKIPDAWATVLVERLKSAGFGGLKKPHPG